MMVKNRYHIFKICKLVKLRLTVNGGWGEFGDWEECPVSCGGGEQKRVRACNSPAPAHGGDDCTADGSSSAETRNCNENLCPSK